MTLRGGFRHPDNVYAKCRRCGHGCYVWLREFDLAGGCKCPQCGGKMDPTELDLAAVGDIARKRKAKYRAKTNRPPGLPRSRGIKRETHEHQ